MDTVFRFAIDRGGTFTDVYVEVVKGGVTTAEVHKLLSVDPQNYADAPTEGIRRVLEEKTGVPHPKGEQVDTSRIQWIRMGTTVATNALLEREGERSALVMTKGLRDVLKIGNQVRLFGLMILRRRTKPNSGKRMELRTGTQNSHSLLSLCWQSKTLVEAEHLRP